MSCVNRLEDSDGVFQQVQPDQCKSQSDPSLESKDDDIDEVHPILEIEIDLKYPPSVKDLERNEAEILEFKEVDNSVDSHKVNSNDFSSHEVFESRSFDEKYNSPPIEKIDASFDKTPPVKKKSKKL